MARRPRRQGRRAGPARISASTSPAKTYDVGDLVTAGGSAWYCGHDDDHGAGQLGRLATDGQARARRAGRPLMAVTLEDAKRASPHHRPGAGPRGELHARPRRRHRPGLPRPAGRRPTVAHPDLVDRGTLLTLAHYWEHRGDDGAPDDYAAALWRELDLLFKRSRDPGPGLADADPLSAGQHRPGPAPGARSSRPAPPCPTPKAGLRAPGRRCRPSSWYVRIRPATAGDVERALAGTLITHRSLRRPRPLSPRRDAGHADDVRGRGLPGDQRHQRRRARSRNGTDRRPAGVSDAGHPDAHRVRRAHGGARPAWRPDLTAAAGAARGGHRRRRRQRAAGRRARRHRAPAQQHPRRAAAPPAARGSAPRSSSARPMPHYVEFGTRYVPARPAFVPITRRAREAFVHGRHRPRQGRRAQGDAVADRSLVDAALLELLANDAALKALCPGRRLLGPGPARRPGVRGRRAPGRHARRRRWTARRSTSGRSISSRRWSWPPAARSRAMPPPASTQLLHQAELDLTAGRLRGDGPAGASNRCASPKSTRSTSRARWQHRGGQYELWSYPAA